MATKSFIKTIGSKGLLADYNTEGKKLQTELIAGDNITIGGSTISSDQLFVAKYGTTTYQEIKDAYYAGKICTVLYASRYFYVTRIDSSHILFASSNGTEEMYSVSVGSGNTWSFRSAKLQSKLTFDSAPKAGSTNPVTSDGIKTAIDAKQNSLTAGNNITIDGSTISSDQVFVATYGSTKYAEIKKAYDAGKICVLFKDKRCHYIELISPDKIRFIAVSAELFLSACAVSSTDNWTQGIIFFQSKLTFDTTPTAGSNNPVTSDGIKKALDSRIPSPTSTTGTQVLKCIDGVIQWVNE